MHCMNWASVIILFAQSSQGKWLHYVFKLNMFEQSHQILHYQVTRNPICSPPPEKPSVGPESHLRIQHSCGHFVQRLCWGKQLKSYSHCLSLVSLRTAADGANTRQIIVEMFCLCRWDLQLGEQTLDRLLWKSSVYVDESCGWRYEHSASLGDQVALFGRKLLCISWGIRKWCIGNRQGVIVYQSWMEHFSLSDVGLILKEECIVQMTRVKNWVMLR